MVGALTASVQVKLSRVLAYSSVSQAGAILILFGILGLLNSDMVSLISALFIVSYSLVMLHFTSIYSSIKQFNLMLPLESIKTLSFIKTSSLALQAVFTTFVFNLSGMPPLLGWVLKSSVLAACGLLSFNLFYAFDSMSIFNLELMFKNISSCELSLLSFFFGKIEHVIFYFFLVISVIIFLALIVSVHYSMQLFKVAFAEFNNVSVESLRFEILPISVSNSALIFTSSLMNVFGFLFIISIIGLFLI